MLRNVVTSKSEGANWYASFWDDPKVTADFPNPGWIGDPVPVALSGDGSESADGDQPHRRIGGIEQFDESGNRCDVFLINCAGDPCVLGRGIAGGQAGLLLWSGAGRGRRDEQSKGHQ